MSIYIDNQNRQPPIISLQDKQKKVFNEGVYPNFPGVTPLAAFTRTLVAGYPLDIRYDPKSASVGNNLISTGYLCINGQNVNTAYTRQYKLDERKPQPFSLGNVSIEPTPVDVENLKSGTWFMIREGCLACYSDGAIHYVSDPAKTLSILLELGKQGISIPSDEAKKLENTWRVALGETISFKDVSGREYYVYSDSDEPAAYFHLRIMRRGLPEEHRATLEVALANMFQNLEKDKAEMSLLGFFNAEIGAVYLFAGNVIQKSSGSSTEWKLYESKDSFGNGVIRASTDRLLAEGNDLVLLVSTAPAANQFVQKAAEFLHDEAGVKHVRVSMAEEKGPEKILTEKEVNGLLASKIRILEADAASKANASLELQKQLETVQATFLAAQNAVKKARDLHAAVTLVHKDLSAPIGQFGKGDRINTAAGNLNAALSKYKPESEQLV